MSRPAWERQDNLDTSESWPYFKAFRDLKGARQLRRVRLSVPGVATTLEQLRTWHDAHDWKARTAAYDGHMDSVLQGEREAIMKVSAADLATQHMELVADAYEIAQRGLESLVQASRETEAAGLLKPGELIKLMEEAAIKLGRLVKGEATEIVEDKGPDFSSLSLDELRKLRELQAKTKK